MQGMTTEMAIVVVLWLSLLLLLLLLLLVVLPGGRRLVALGNKVDIEDAEEREARSDAWKFIWIMVASIVRVVNGVIDVTSVERRVSNPDKVTVVGIMSCVVDAARAPSVPFIQVITGSAVEAMIC